MKHHVELVLKVLQFIMNSCDHKNTGGQMFPLEVFLYAQIFPMATWKKSVLSGLFIGSSCCAHDCGDYAIKERPALSTASQESNAFLPVRKGI